MKDKTNIFGDIVDAIIKQMLLKDQKTIVHQLFYLFYETIESYEKEKTN